MTSAAPARSLDQRLAALQRANEIRTKRAQLKRELKDGRVAFVDLLLSPPDYIETAKVFDLLLAAPKFGRVRTNKLLVQARVAPSKTFGGLSRRQRDELASLVGHHSLSAIARRRAARRYASIPSSAGRDYLSRALERVS